MFSLINDLVIKFANTFITLIVEKLVDFIYKNRDGNENRKFNIFLENPIRL